ncbi:hypothetical protein SAMN04487944_11380 [Gracilibacillus ureilyticus]|uniref:Uncharacterized protein n=1 Tax=Gracilibacillus ureilyticus TaxID=531814 RepID=A0A1H9TAR5_9BACI|nr:hypothetical protein SAMN04487944_11380 [Gracilibacillus ureilyticus]
MLSQSLIFLINIITLQFIVSAAWLSMKTTIRRFTNGEYYKKG